MTRASGSERSSCKTYLGDSVWAARDGQYIALTVGPSTAHPDIYLDEATMRRLLEFHKQQEDSQS